MISNEKSSKQNSPLDWGFIILRIIIGWYFLYEGLIKLSNPDWTAAGFLRGTHGLFSGLFHGLASSPAMLGAVNILNIWGLILIGLGLMLGILARTSVMSGIILLFLYYLAYPPFHLSNFNVPQEGHYMLVDKNLILLVTLILLLLFPRTLNIGITGLFSKYFNRSPKPSEKPEEKPDHIVTPGPAKGRREILKHLAFLPFLGGFTWAFLNNKKYVQANPDAITGGTIVLNRKTPEDLIGKMPMGTVAGKPVSRLIMGNNLIGGWAHSRDLLYTPSLFKAYNTEKKVFETLMLGEQAGINTMNIVTAQMPLVNRYKKMFGSSLQLMVQAGALYDISRENIIEDIDRSIDLGVDFIQIWGAACDTLARDGKAEDIVKCVEHARKQGYPAGIGGHDIHTFLACAPLGPEPDFYFKTLHHDHYWSALRKEDRYPYGVMGSDIPGQATYHDNMWCYYPEMTIEFISKTQKPVFAYKVLAAGAIPPQEGFQFAFDNGADFICVGMFDFQIVDDVNHTIKCVEKAENRSRIWVS